jgi:hypothetical protein
VVLASLTSKDTTGKSGDGDAMTTATSNWQALLLFTLDRFFLGTPGLIYLAYLHTKM